MEEVPIGGCQGPGPLWTTSSPGKEEVLSPKPFHDVHEKLSDTKNTEVSVVTPESNAMEYDPSEYDTIFNKKVKSPVKIDIINI